MRWTVHALNAEVEAEIMALPADMQARYLRLADLIEAHGLDRIGAPHIKHLDGKLWELRITGRDGIARAIYVTATGRRVVVLHAFVKKTQKTPRQALETARKRLQELTP
jgi:phage-related protein